MTNLTLDVNIIDFPSIPVAMLPHRCSPELLNYSVAKFIRWRKETGLSPVDQSQTFGVAWDDPATTAPEAFRFDICGSVSEPIPDNRYGVSNGELTGGRYAVASHVGELDDISRTVWGIIRPVSYTHLLLLDSQVFGVPHGELSEFQLEWLERKLADAPERHTLLLLHHHPLPAGCSWLDQHSLRNAGELDTVLAKFPHVKYLLCGHIHQELDLDWNGRRLLATPSTCVQFKPHCSNFTLDTIAPGWRCV